ncbi:Mariner Mos1 transposase [Acromyrmex echinatior]|uniref:Mariner Mos1 transposase n=1 Tax=Acromyrmex echinatior TaxID=103372 RepID=F4WSD6_ACREC|nr:Mariner Mos1 transposase [Acromyrmex echinatior]
MSDFVPNNRHMREVLIFFFHSKKTAAEAHRELQKVYGDAALSETTCRDWFRRFKDDDFDVDDRPREGRPKTFEDAELEALLDEDPCQTQEELASVLGVTRQAISKRLHALGMIQKQGTWVPYELPRDVERRFFVCEQLLQRQKRKGFLHCIVTGDEKWITATQREESHRGCPVMLLRRRLGRIFTLRRLCCVFGGTRSVLFIMSY